MKKYDNVLCFLQNFYIVYNNIRSYNMSSCLYLITIQIISLCLLEEYHDFELGVL